MTDNLDAAGIVSGSHTAHGVEYGYVASWTRSSDVVEWTATIKRGEQTAAEVGGVVNPVELGSDARDVCLAVEAAIETGAEFQDEE